MSKLFNAKITNIAGLVERVRFGGSTEFKCLDGQRITVSDSKHLLTGAYPGDFFELELSGKIVARLIDFNRPYSEEQLSRAILNTPKVPTAHKHNYLDKLDPDDFDQIAKLLGTGNLANYLSNCITNSSHLNAIVKSLLELFASARP